MRSLAGEPRPESDLSRTLSPFFKREVDERIEPLLLLVSFFRSSASSSCASFFDG